MRPSFMDDETALERQDDAEFILEPEELDACVRAAEEQCGLVVRGDPGMVRVLEELVLQRRSHAITTLVGEPGVGKEKFARFVHFLRNSGGPFVDVNMAGISEHLFESELFGHAKGAFTSANGERMGRFEQAGKGTLFLDEVGDMPYDRQGLLLRAFEQRTFSRVGDNRQLTLDATIVCATNADIHHAVSIGRMRRDLHDRLCSCVVVIPPFQERAHDHRVHLMRYLAHKIGMECGCTGLEIEPEAMQMFLEHPVGGNVRGIENVLRRVGGYVSHRQQSRIGKPLMRRALEEVRKAEDTSFMHTDLRTQLIRQAMDHGLSAAIEPLKGQIVRAVLEHSEGNQSRTAKILGISRQFLRRLLAD
ncbi:MAG: sigma 54-interacting transcriptional regulator [Candidatus Peribacter sp.]|nr:sigma 54-interacting transcriptional regulator [Candidatus Peribacter sp.]